jgi:hypothetical protein
MDRTNFKESEYYECTPVSLLVPAVPVFSGTISRRQTEFPVIGVEGAVCQLERARKETDVKLRRCREQVQRGNRYAVVELIDQNPAFISDSWVSETLLRLQKSGLSLRRPGRRFGSYEMWHPLVVIGLVNHLVKSDHAKNREEAFRMLAELGFFSSYDAAKAAYYRALGNKHIVALLFENPSAARIVPAATIKEKLERANSLQPGSAVQYKSGQMQINFRAI